MLDQMMRILWKNLMKLTLQKNLNSGSFLMSLIRFLKDMYLNYVGKGEVGRFLHGSHIVLDVY